MNIDWKVYYDDGTSYDSSNDIRKIPRTGVEVIVQKDEEVGYRLFYTEGDYFVYDSDRGGWRITDIFGVWDHLVIVENPLVLFGREMERKQFKHLLNKIREECGVKSGWLQGERKL